MKVHPNAKRPVDTSVSVPDAVKAMGAQADELMRKAQEDRERAERGEEPGDASQDGQQEAQDGQQEAQDGQERGQERQERQEQRPLQPQPREPQRAQERGQEPRQDDTEARLVHLEQLVSTERGRTSTLAKENNNLRRLLAEMRSQPSAPSEPARPTAPAQSLTDEELTDEERNDYGEDMLRVVDKVAARRLRQVEQHYAGQLNQMQSRLDELSTATGISSQERFNETMLRLVPNFMQLNEDRNFIAWLNVVEPYTGQRRHDLLRDAYELQDANRTAAFFTDFMASQAPAQQGQDTKRQNGRAPAPAKPTLESLAAPGRARTSTAAQADPEEKPTWTRAEIAAFYGDVNRGKFRGREKEQREIEAEIFDAQNDGRVR